MLMCIELGIIPESSSFLFLTSIKVISSLLMILNSEALIVLYFFLKKENISFVLEINVSVPSS